MGACVGKSNRGKGTNWIVMVDGKGISLGRLLTKASPLKVKLAHETLDTIKVPRPCKDWPRKRGIRSKNLLFTA